MRISQESIELIIAWEVGGGDRELARPLYEAKYHRPHWPGNGGSGLTIGIGYDLRWSRDWFEADWKKRLEALRAPKDAYTRLSRYLGMRGSRESEARTKDISIPWDDAMTVFRVRRLPDFVSETERAFPGVETMHPHVCGALTSVVYNCGTNLRGSTRVLKKAAFEAIAEAVAARSVPGVAAGIRSLKAFHDRSPKVAKGLNKRREDEARLVESAARAQAA